MVDSAAACLCSHEKGNSWNNHNSSICQRELHVSITAIEVPPRPSITQRMPSKRASWLFISQKVGRVRFKKIYLLRSLAYCAVVSHCWGERERDDAPLWAARKCGGVA